MNEIEDKLDRLYHIEENIESYYINLVKLEIDGKKDSIEYDYYLKLISEETWNESDFFRSLDLDMIYAIRKRVEKDNFNKNTDKPIALGFIAKAYYFRISNMLDLLIGDSLFDYADVLRYDINQILFSFLDYIIDNDYYEEIREDLIFYKYNQIFLNNRSEYDFLLFKDSNAINLLTNNYRTEDLLSRCFVDKAILGLESLDFITFITNCEENFKEEESSYSLMIISIINILARLVLCEEDMMNVVYSKLEALQRDDSISNNIKNTIGEMFDILDIIKHKIFWTR